MTIRIITKVHTIILVCAVAGLMACSEGSRAAKDAATQTQVATTPTASSNLSFTEFEPFFAAFIESLESNEWQRLKVLTHFPLVVKGDLDDEGTVIISSDEFSEFLKPFMKEETYLTIDDKLVATTYTKSLTGYQDKIVVTADHAELNNFIFQKDNNYWKLVEIITYLHLIEKYKDGSE